MVYANELIIFIHIAKTGGTTLRGILDKQYGSNSLFMYAHETFENLNSEDKLVNMLKSHINNVKSISGHFGFGMKYNGIDTPLLYLMDTSRNIVYISILRNPVERLFSQYHHYKRNNWIDFDITFEKFVKQNLYIPNYQTLCLSGTNIPNLEIAKRNIIKHFALVG
ncbi:sulfotransferase family 2 domain-containing protein, partial [Bacillus sp. SN10]|uniref:sulfotransferase family 2 domain-containing protein n=1 Tax=Bacillus sp. SN10 TaxID=2056493 RepID=UPI000CAB885F